MVDINFYINECISSVRLTTIQLVHVYHTFCVKLPLERHKNIKLILSEYELHMYASHKNFTRMRGSSIFLGGGGGGVEVQGIIYYFVFQEGEGQGLGVNW